MPDNKLVTIELVLVIAMTVGACCLALDKQSNSVFAASVPEATEQKHGPRLAIQTSSTPAENLLNFVSTTSDGKYKLLPLEELRTQYHQAGLLATLLRGGV